MSYIPEHATCIQLTHAHEFGGESRACHYHLEYLLNLMSLQISQVRYKVCSHCICDYLKISRYAKLRSCRTFDRARVSTPMCRISLSSCQSSIGSAQPVLKNMFSISNSSSLDTIKESPIGRSSMTYASLMSPGNELCAYSGFSCFSR
jgi:hypothetical protein